MAAHESSGGNGRMTTGRVMGIVATLGATFSAGWATCWEIHDKTETSDSSHRASVEPKDALAFWELQQEILREARMIRAIVERPR